MISAISWVPKGASKSQPVVTDLPSKEEIEEFINGENEENDEDMGIGANDQDDEGAQALTVAGAVGKPLAEKCDDITPGLKELDMDNYDEEDEGVELFSSGIGDLYYPSNDLDPYLKHENDDDSEEVEDMTIYPTDSVVVCALTKKHDCCLEVLILDDTNSSEINQYIRNDIMITTCPLCIAWSDSPLKGGERGNFIAVGFEDEPSIETWDLHIVDEVKPCTVLGGFAKKKKKGKEYTCKCWC